MLNRISVAGCELRGAWFWVSEIRNQKLEIRSCAWLLILISYFYLLASNF